MGEARSPHEVLDALDAYVLMPIQDAGGFADRLWEGSHRGAGLGGYTAPVFAARAPCHTAGTEGVFGRRSAPDLGVLVKPLALLFGRVVPSIVVAGRHGILPLLLPAARSWIGEANLRISRATTV